MLLSEKIEEFSPQGKKLFFLILPLHEIIVFTKPTMVVIS